MRRFCLIPATAIFVLLSPVTKAQEAACGKAPEFTLTKEESEKAQGDLAGSANSLKGFIGDASLGGKILAERKKYYQTDSAIEHFQRTLHLESAQAFLDAVDRCRLCVDGHGRPPDWANRLPTAW
jgi:hypothetical protein